MKYLIIGASAAGLSAAKTLRMLEPTSEITVVSEDTEVISRCMLHHLISEKRTAGELNFVDSNFFEKNNIQWIKGERVTTVLPALKQVQLATGELFPYEKLLVATGASAMIPPIPGLREGKQVFALRNLSDVKAIAEQAQGPQQAVVIGGGLVGVDAATSLAERGLKVTIVEMGPYLMPLQLDQATALQYEERFREHQIETLTSKRVEQVMLDEAQNVREVALADGTFVQADLIVVATGVRPNIELVKKTAVAIDRGILVDEYQQTNVADLYAAGDVCQSYEVFRGEKMLTPIWPVAVRQGEVAAYNMAGIQRSLAGSFAIRNSISFFGLSTISYGLTEAPDESYHVKVFLSQDRYRKFIVKDGRLRGVILQGDLEGAGVYGELIQDGIDISRLIGRLDEVTYADFFCQDEMGQFSYDCVTKAG